MFRFTRKINTNDEQDIDIRELKGIFIIEIGKEKVVETIKGKTDIVELASNQQEKIVDEVYNETETFIFFQ